MRRRLHQGADAWRQSLNTGAPRSDGKEMKNQAPAKVVGFQDEALRRMARKAGVSAVAKSGKHMAKVDDQLRAIADSILDAACGRIHILCDYYKSKTVTTAILQTALEEHVPDQYYPDGGANLPLCTSHRAASASAKREAKAKAKAEAKKLAGASPAAKAAARARAVRAAASAEEPPVGRAAQEIAYEDTNFHCLYNERAPFVRLVRERMRRQQESARNPGSIATVLRPSEDIKFSADVLGTLQAVVESLLIKVLRTAGEIVRMTTVGPRGGKPRATINQRDILAATSILGECHPLLRGNIERAPANVAEDEAGAPDRGRGRGRGSARGRGRGRASSGGREGRGRGAPEGRGGRGRASPDSHGRGGSRGRDVKHSRGRPRAPRAKSTARDAEVAAARAPRAKKEPHATPR